MKDNYLEIRYIMYLVSLSLRNQKTSVLWDGVDLKKVFEISKRQRISALVYSGMDSSLCDEELDKKFNHEVDVSIWLDSMQEIEKAAMFEAFLDAGIRFMPLKGCIMKGLYPESYLRTMSDFDILIDADNAYAARDVMEALGYMTVGFGLEHHDRYEKGKGIYAEIHRSLVDEDVSVSEFYDVLKDAWEDERIVNDSENKMMYTQTREEFYIFMLTHAAKHFFWSGFGIRFIIDIGVYRNKFKDVLDWEHVYKTLSRMKILKFSKTVERIADCLYDDTIDFRGGSLYDVNGLGKEEIQETEDMMIYLFRSSIYGDTAQMVSAMTENYNISNKSMLIFDSMIRRVFPKKKYMKIVYPILNKKSWLLPFCWVDRIVRWIFSRKKGRLEGELSSIKGVDVEIFRLKSAMKDN